MIINKIDISVNQNLIENRNWVVQFGTDYKIPDWLQLMVDDKFAEDTSWHHDVSPSITFLEILPGEKQVVVFIDHADEMLRETPHRFSFFYRDAGDDLTEALYCQTDDEAREFLKKKLSEKHFRVK